MAGVLVLGAAGRQASDAAFERALDAWDAGDYPAALAGFRSVLTGEGGGRYLEQVALRTGELFTVTELATDGRSVRFSPDGRHAAFDIGSRSRPRVRVVDLSTATHALRDIEGSRLVFSPIEQTAAYLRVAATPEIVRLREELDRLSRDPEADRRQQTRVQQGLAELESANVQVVVCDLQSGREQVLDSGSLRALSLAFSADGRDVYVAAGRPGETDTTDIYAVTQATGALRQLTSGPGRKSGVTPVAGGRVLLYTVALPAGAGRGAAPAGGRGARASGGQAAADVVVLNLTDRVTTTFRGTAPVVSEDGSTLAFLARAGEQSVIQIVRLAGDRSPAVVKQTPQRIGSLALSRDGSRVAFEMPDNGNQEIFCINADGTGEVRVSREIQHDREPRFVGAGRILAVKGEERHSRAFLYDLASLTAMRVFHNNTLRTIAPEYEWAVGPSGTQLLVVADRDGDTISPERGVYLVDLTRKVTEREVLARLDANLAAEHALRARAAAQFKPVLSEIARVTERVSIRRIYEYEEALSAFGSKDITQPGNRRAAEYISATLRSFGYRPEYQTFTAPGGIQTANVLATLTGVENPELVYVMSSHFDSVARGPGADDNGSGAAVLLETARVMAATPMPATVVFAALTGEEAGLLGSREFVRQAVATQLKVVGALNNDTLGWTNDHRLDNTIRYANAGIRDLQHGASFLFSRMVTYDARYFRSTDAAAYVEAYGDIVGGFGSYPILGSPHYHQATDLLETVNHHLLFEAAKANVASIMRLACGPSRVTGLRAERDPRGAVKASWTPSPEKGLVRYRVRYGPAGQAPLLTVSVAQPKVTIPASASKPATTLEIAVTALTSRGLESWDAARTTVAPPK